MQQTVFISYSSKDADVVSGLVEILAKNEITYWKAPEMIPAGSNYAKEIPHAIAQCRVFLLAVSRASQSSIWVEKELDCAINNGKIVVPVLLDSNPMSDMFRFYLNNVQTIDLSENKEKALLQLVARLKALLLSDLSSNKDGAVRIKTEQTNAVHMTYEKGGESATKRENVFTYNKVPSACESCGFELKKIGEGQFKCKKCGAYSYDTFHKIKNYLEKNGARSMTQIANATGIPKSSVEHFLKEGRLEIAQTSFQFLKCMKCGRAIRTGSLCLECQRQR